MPALGLEGARVGMLNKHAGEQRFRAREPIVVLTTGGTIDKAYFDALSEYQVGETVVGHLLRVAQVAHPFRIVEVSRKDSLELTDEDRERVVAAVMEVAEARIVITHGTDTMVQTAARLEALDAPKIIVLTGAMSPARFSESDAGFNLGMAFGAVQLGEPGVYIAMSGRVFWGCNARKDREAGGFLST